ncbi:hypothetical protein OTU49_004146 [Cherax quadricarinatus]|uniref:Protein kinase domain-containing protein n=1 Tax=Cherax quadricarinatus TaxID=27406 RepID=A0AAW0X1S8_CHEQU
MHENNIIHGSVKQSNVIISTEQGVVETTLIDYSRCVDIGPEYQQEIEKDIKPLVKMFTSIFLTGKRKKEAMIIINTSLENHILSAYFMAEIIEDFLEQMKNEMTEEAED